MKIEEKTMENKVTFYEETNFKNTELGEIPADWEVVKLCGLIVDEMNGDWGKGVKENPDFTECFVLRGTDFQKVANGDFEEVPIRFLKGSSLIKRRLQDGDVLVELSGGGEKQPTGRVLLARRNWLEKVHLPVVFSNFVKRIRISDSVCFSEYFYLYWKLLYQNKKTSLYERRTTGIRNFKYKDFVQNESIPLPPLEEQKAIAYVLSTVQEAREKTEKVIEATKELKKSLMKYLFTYGPVSLEEASRINLKETEIGEIPADWEVVKLGEVAEIVMGQSPPGTSYNSSGKGIPFLQGKAEFGAVMPKHLKYTTVPLKIGKMGSVLLSVRAPVGDVNLADKDYCIGRGLASITMKNGNNHYLFYTLKHLKGYIERESYGSTFKAISKPVLTNFLVPLPPLEEQKAIAYVLSTVQEAREKTEKVIEATKELKKSLMKHLFTYGPVSLEEASRINLKETEIGEIPADWEVVKLGEVALRMKAGGTPRTVVKKFWDGDIPFVLIEDMTSQGVFLSKTKRTITQEGLKNSNSWLVPANSLLVSMYATIGETAVNLIPVATNQAIIAIVPRENFDVLYGAYFIKYDSVRLQMQNIQSTQKNVNRAIVENFPIPLPPLPVQQRIAEILQTVDEKIQAEEKKKQALDSLFNSMLHMLMSGKLRVKFQTSEEGASD